MLLALASLLPLLQNAALSLMWDQTLFQRTPALAWLLAAIAMAAAVPLYLHIWRSESGPRRLLPPLCWLAASILIAAIGQLVGKLGTFWTFLPKVMLLPLAGSYFLIQDAV